MKKFSKKEWEARKELAACYRLAFLFGFGDLIWNHITLRIPGTEHFLINKFGLRYDEITASNLVKIDIEGNSINILEENNSEEINLTGYIIHSAIHSIRADIMCVMHSHTEAGMAVSALKDGLIPMTIDALPFYNRISYHSFEGLSVDIDERKRIGEALGTNKAMILRNHGLLTCGHSVGETFVKMYYLDRACKVQLQVQSTGKEIELPSAEIAEKTANQSTTYPHGLYEWPALLRLVNSKCPGYDN